MCSFGSAWCSIPNFSVFGTLIAFEFSRICFLIRQVLIGELSCHRFRIDNHFSPRVFGRDWLELHFYCIFQIIRLSYLSSCFSFEASVFQFVWPAVDFDLRFTCFYWQYFSYFFWVRRFLILFLWVLLPIFIFILEEHADRVDLLCR